MRPLPKDSLREVKGMLVDMGTATHHPETLRTPPPEATRIRRVMHMVHYGLHAVGIRLAEKHKRKQPDWAKGEQLNVIGYGGEKIVYKIEGDAEHLSRVVSVYHKDSLRKDPVTLLEQKRGHYNTYVQYFGDLVLPTEFEMVDNPWGNGKKPASIQAYLEGMTLLSDMTKEEIEARKNSDSQFERSCEALSAGYLLMRDDGLCPDLASSNVIVTDKGIQLFDTGVIYPVSSLGKLKSLQPNYTLVESL